MLISIVSGLEVARALLVLLITTAFLAIWWREKRPRNFPPGPVGLPFLGYIPFLYPDTLTKIEGLRRKYGNIFSMKIGADWFVILSDLDMMKKALSKTEFSGRPKHMLFMVNAQFGIGYNDGPAWHEQRKFTIQQLKQLGYEDPRMEEVIQDEVNSLIRHLETTTAATSSREEAEAVDLKNIIGASILNLSWRIAAGVKFQLSDPKLLEVFDSLRKGFIEPVLQSNVYFLPWIAEKFENLTGYKLLKDSLRKVDDAVREIIQKHQESHAHGSAGQQVASEREREPDFVDSYLEKLNGLFEKGSSFYGKAAGDNIVGTIGNMFVSPTVTLTSTLSFALLYLTGSRDVLKRMQAEISKITSNLRAPSYKSDRADMPFTQAVIQETFRLSSIAAGAALHSTSADVEFMGYSIPKNTVIMPNMYAVHHSKEYWGDPEVFRPSRFINPDGTFRKDEAVNPFGVGKRACIARNIAAPTQLFQYLTSLVQAFDFIEHEAFPLPSFEAQPAIVLNPHRYRVVLVPRSESPLKH